jgi:FlaG/FlaF family flagellin (archaellin)
MPSLRTLLVAVALTLVGGCSSFVTGMGESANAALEQALQVGIDGFETADAPAPPTAICESSSDPAPQVDASLRGPASAAYTDGDAELDAWAWRTSSPDAAAGLVDEAVDGSDACEQEWYADYDTDGDGQLDAGSSTVTTAGRYDRSGWRGVAVRTGEDGDPTVETRYVRRDDVVVLVTLTDGGDDAAAIVDDYLAAVAAAL